MMKRKYITVSIPVPLYNKVKESIEGTGFTSVSDYVTFVLRELMAGMEEKNTKKVFSNEDEKLILDRLRSLGYLD